MFSGLITIARAEISLIFRRGLIAFAGTILMLGALGLGIAAGVVETANHVGVAASLGIWGGVTFLVSAGVLMMASSRRRTMDPSATRAAIHTSTGAGPVPVTGSSAAVQDAYRLGEQIGGSVSPVVLLGGVLALGILTGRKRG